MNNPIESQTPGDPAKPPSSAGPTPSTTRGPLFAGGPPDIPDHELLRCIGRGAYGEVWLARNVMGTYRAVKVVYRRTFEHDRPYEREFTGIRRFEPVSRKHHSQVDILHVGRDNERGYFYYVMELADDASAEFGMRSAESGGAEDEKENRAIYIVPPWCFRGVSTGAAGTCASWLVERFLRSRRSKCGNLRGRAENTSSRAKGNNVNSPISVSQVLTGAHSRLPDDTLTARTRAPQPSPKLESQR